MSLKMKLMKLLSNPKVTITHKKAASRFGVNTGAVGSARLHLPKRMQRQILRESDVA